MHKRMEAIIKNHKIEEKQTEEVKAKKLRRMRNDEVGDPRTNFNLEAMELMYREGVIINTNLALGTSNTDWKKKIHIEEPEVVEDAECRELAREFLRKIEMEGVEMTILLNNHRMAKRRAKRTADLSKRPPWDSRTQPMPSKYIPQRMDRPAYTYDLESKRKINSMNLTRIYGSRVLKPEVVPVGRYPKSLMDRHVRAIKTNIANENMKDRLIRANSKVSTFRIDITQYLWDHYNDPINFL